ncbi:MAG: 3-deoxy-7-phosphoheptulonate synthase [Bacteroidetes bacterium]|nr:3-deoxy-7-phosphoheptulonate synthase [Bacteroidota bacterium]
MIIQLEPKISEQAKAKLLEKINETGFKTTEVRTQFRHCLVGTGSKEFDIRTLGNLPGVADIHRVSDPFKLVSRKWRVEDTLIDLGDGVTLCRGDLAMMAGPCSIESEEQVFSTINHLKANGLRIMRGGVFKPRSSPYSFRGMGLDGLKMWSALAREHGIKIISEVMHTEQIEAMYPYVDIFQVGARNAQNFNLLDALGGVDKPVMLKRGMSGTIEELLQAAEYVFSNGNEKIILCERGIRTYETASRNTFDINAIPILKDKSHLPVVADPSHGIGIRSYVAAVALAAVMAGADGVIVEVHESPEKAASDGAQTLDFEEAGRLYGRMRAAVALRDA